LAEEKKMPQVTWKDVQGTLKPREAAVELVRFRFHDRKQWTDKTYYVALIVTTETKSAPALVSLGEAEDLEDVPLMKYRDLSSEHSVNARPDDSVFRSLWQPMESALGTAQRIYLSPDGVLNLVSFPVLPIGHERRLMDKYDLRVVSSTKDLVREGSSTASKSAVLIGDPQFDLTEAQQRAALQKVSPGSSESGSFVASGTSGLRSQELREGKKLAALPGSKAEIASIRSLLQKQGWWVDVYTQESATEESIQRLQGPRLLHVATHAFFLSDQAEIFSKTSPRLPPGFEDPMLRSGLFFAGANRVLQGEKPAEDLEDGILTAYEATDLNLQGTELVVLSACETGLGKIGNGEGVFGLRRALEEAGAQAVLMSLWAVPDRETQELMTLFYNKWLAGEDKQQALHDAEMELRATVKARYGEDRPFYWGGFVLVGSDKSHGASEIPSPTLAPKGDSTVTRTAVNGNEQAAKIIELVEPVYPPLARQARIQGTVRLHAIIGTDGRIEELEAISGHPLLIQSAIDAVRKWRYAPTSVNGQPADVETIIDVVFSLEKDYPQSP